MILLVISFFLTAACLIPPPLFADIGKQPSEQKMPSQEEKKEQMPQPWLTGPLLTPSGHVVPQGHYNIEPYVYVTDIFGRYNKNWQSQDLPHSFYNVLFQFPIQVGMPAHFDFTFVPQFSWNHTHGASHWVLNDMPWGFDYQLIQDESGKWWPAVKLQLRANFPFGKYQKLDRHENGTDVGGTGSWLPSIGFVMSRLYWWGGHIFFAPRFNVQYTIPNSVHVKGFNAYGGGHRTHGTVYPGQSLTVLFGFELALSQRWALANDIQYLHVNKTRFRGHKGKTNGVPNEVGGPSSEQFSIAPGIEYNWNAYVGIIGGVWLSFAGRNASDFWTGIIAINIYK